MHKTVACVIARTNSTRLPLKVLRDVAPGLSVLDFLLQRMTRTGIPTFLCTSVEPEDDILEDVAARNDAELYRGSPTSVIDRMIDVARQTDADSVIRITGDNPLTAVEYLPHQAALLQEHDLDYVRLADAPLGATGEVMRCSALRDCYERIDPSVSEYLMLYMFDPAHYRCGVVRAAGIAHPYHSLTVDVPNDLQRTRDLVAHAPGDPLEITLTDVLGLLDSGQVPTKRVAGDARIKLPFGESMSFTEYLADMDARASKSRSIAIP
jgi:spore coat polysaccharide biosynthesis protein SpsF (cytidylyltransferase family)